MDSTQSIEQAFRYLEPASLVFLILRLIGQGLVTRYRAFAAYLLIWLCQDVLPLLFGWSLGSDAYALFFFVSEPWEWVFSCLVLLELFDLTFTGFPGIRSAGKLLLTVAILVGVFVGTWTAVPTLIYRHDAGGMLLLFFVIERSVMLVTLVLLGALQYLGPSLPAPVAAKHGRVRLHICRLFHNESAASVCCERARSRL